MKKFFNLFLLLALLVSGYSLASHIHVEEESMEIQELCEFCIAGQNFSAVSLQEFSLSLVNFETQIKQDFKQENFTNFSYLIQNSRAPPFFIFS